MTKNNIILDQFDALIVVDAQNDFLAEKGSLRILGGIEVLGEVNRWITTAILSKIPIYFTYDWHPMNHMSFTEQGGSWPTHCVQDTWGAKIHKAVFKPNKAYSVYKGTDPDIEDYSPFNPRTNLGKLLREKDIKRTLIVGFATEYCVRATALDALKEGFEIVLVTDAVKEISKKDEVFAELVSKGANLSQNMIMETEI